MVGMLRFGLGISFSIVLVATMGCGPGSSFPEGTTGTLSGTVTLDGEPVPVGTSITFIHEETSQPAVAVTKEGGAYTAKMRGEPKVLTGKYRVTVADPPQETATNEEMQAIYEGRAEAKPQGAIPAKYNVAETSGLTVVVDEGDNTYDISMTTDS